MFWKKNSLIKYRKQAEQQGGNPLGRIYQWIAIKGHAIDYVIEQINPKESLEINWSHGVYAALKNNIFFIGSSNDNTVYIISEFFPSIYPFLEKYSNVFDNIYHIGVLDKQEYFSWIYFHKGNKIRSFVYEAKIMENIGKITSYEEKLITKKTITLPEEALAMYGDKTELIADQFNTIKIANFWKVNLWEDLESIQNNKGVLFSE